MYTSDKHFKMQCEKSLNVPLRNIQLSVRTTQEDIRHVRVEKKIDNCKRLYSNSTNDTTMASFLDCMYR